MDAGQLDRLKEESIKKVAKEIQHKEKKDAREETLKATEFPKGSYRIIYADPPWSYDDKKAPGSAFKAAVVEGTERAVTFMLTKEDQLVDNGFLRAFKDGLCQAIKEQLTKGESPCKAPQGENNG